MVCVFRTSAEGLHTSDLSGWLYFILIRNISVHLLVRYHFNLITAYCIKKPPYVEPRGALLFVVLTQRCDEIHQGSFIGSLMLVPFNSPVPDFGRNSVIS